MKHAPTLRLPKTTATKMSVGDRPRSAKPAELT